MAAEADVKLASGPRSEVFTARGGPALSDWNGLNVEEQTKLEQRFVALCTADDMLDNRKVRRIKGGPPGIFEIKIKRPPLRAFAFRDGRWWVTHIETKPAWNRVVDEAWRADRIRTQHYERAKSS